MPRGFLVKRSKRASSYRVREEGSELQNGGGAHGPVSAPVRYPSGVPEMCEPVGTGVPVPQLPMEPVHVESVDYYRMRASSPEMSSSSKSPESYSPSKPESAELQHFSYLDRCLSTPVAAESFSLTAPVSSIQRLLMSHALPTFPHQLKRPCQQPQTGLGPELEPGRKSKPPPKKAKVVRKLAFEDEVTTSPVLGLKIKKETPEIKAREDGRKSQKKPLGEFICQLCKEEYPDPFSLAQHKCSRIVRVEYRCPECDKVFSCPANLASHRRWHKPRTGTGSANNHNNSSNSTEAPGGKKTQIEARLQDTSSVEGKENAEQHLLGLDSSWREGGEEHTGTHGTSPVLEPRYMASEKYFDLHLTSNDNPKLFCPTAAGLHLPPTSSSSSSPHSCPSARDDELFPCHFCSKKFRRQAYLRKHLSAHETPLRTSQVETGQVSFPCHLCGGHFPTADIRDKHRLWHAVRDELKISPGQHQHQHHQQLFSCKHCPSSFFSSPGLTRHINKCHPAESPHAILLQMPVRSGY